MKRIYVDMDGVLCNFMKASREHLSLNPKISYPQSQYRFWAELEPIDGAILAFKKLSEDFDVYILTSPSIMNITCYTEKAEWVRKYLGFETLKRLIISKNKSLLIGDYLIDDTTLNGAGDFKGELIKFGTEKYPDWPAVLKYLYSQNG